MQKQSCTWNATGSRSLSDDLIDRRLRCADAIVGCSGYISDRLRRRFPHHATKCVIVYNGVNLVDLSPRPDRASDPGLQNGRVRRAYISRKGLHVLLRAFESVVVRRPEVKLEVVGGAWIPPFRSL